MSSDVLDRHRRDWEELAAVDPLWAILSAPERRGGGWPLEEFFATGEAEIGEVLEVASELGYPSQHERALDFGCGVGRLTRALSGRFQQAVGVDISDEMIRLARELNPGENPSFELNTRSDLSEFPSASFDFVYSALVLQHLPHRDLVRAYLREFVRVLSPGGLAVFQTLEHLPVSLRLQPRRRAYAVLHSLGLRHELLLGRLKLVPVRLSTMSEGDVRSTVEARGGVVERVEEHPKRTDGVRSLRYYVRV